MLIRTSHLPRAEVMGLRKLAKDRGFVDAAEDSFDFINCGKEEWVRRGRAPEFG